MSSISAVHQCLVHATKFNCCSTKLNFITSFLLSCVLQQPRAELGWLQVGSYTAVWIWVVCQYWRNRAATWLNSGKVVTHLLSEKMRFACFHVLPGNAEALVHWGVKINHCLSNISANYYQYQFVFVKAMTKQMWDIFSGHNVLLLLLLLQWWWSWMIFWKRTLWITVAGFCGITNSVEALKELKACDIIFLRSTGSLGMRCCTCYAISPLPVPS